MRTLLGLVVAMSLFACVGDEPDESETGSSIVLNNKLAANKLAANKLAANKLAANKLAANKLAANKLSLSANADDLISTPEGREVLSFVVSCAIAEGQTLVGEFEGVTYEFFGELGLANRWLGRTLDKKGRGWVSACLFSRVNNQNVAVPISLRGPHAQLTSTPDEKAIWTLQEGAFYGEFFTPDDEPINWIACRGSDQAAGEIGGLITRDCAEPDPANPGRTLCGFKYAGDCGAFAPKPVCKKFNVAGTFYQDCAASSKKKHYKGDDDDDGDHDDDDNHDDDDDDCDDDDDGHFNKKRFRQVITTYAIE